MLDRAFPGQRGICRLKHYPHYKMHLYSKKSYYVICDIHWVLDVQWNFLSALNQAFLFLPSYLKFILLNMLFHLLFNHWLSKIKMFLLNICIWLNIILIIFYIAKVGSWVLTNYSPDFSPLLIISLVQVSRGQLTIHATQICFVGFRGLV